jgi:hypothetical protein
VNHEPQHLGQHLGVVLRVEHLHTHRLRDVRLRWIRHHGDVRDRRVHERLRALRGLARLLAYATFEMTTWDIIGANCFGPVDAGTGVSYKPVGV